jgi:aldehyde:ferredoxin oxidoreductase
MHVKGLEITAYNCHAAPAMALSYGTCSIGAHHKDAWVISWEVNFGRDSYSEAKVDKVIDLQRLRGGVFESLTLCRFPHVELGFELEWYPKFLYAATGLELSWSTLNQIADRTLNLIRTFWVREFGRDWTREMDVPPARWFRDPLTQGPLKGAKLDKEKYVTMLNKYYRKRGWDERGIPKKNTLKKLGLSDVANQLDKYVKLAA